MNITCDVKGKCGWFSDVNYSILQSEPLETILWNFGIKSPQLNDFISRIPTVQKFWENKLFADPGFSFFQF